VTGEPGDRPAARLGDEPTRCFADVWSHLPAHPFDVDGERRWRVLDAQLRRIRSWSAALQHIEEFPQRTTSGRATVVGVSTRVVMTVMRERDAVSWTDMSDGVAVVGCSVVR